MSADSTTRATRISLPGGRIGAVGGSRRRWPRRIVLAAVLAGLAAALRERKLAENAKRFGLPG